MGALLLPLGLLAAEVPSPAEQIALAVLAAPKEWQAGVGVWGFDETGELVKLREASNDLVCFGDSPTRDGIHATCVPRRMEYYHVREWPLRNKGLPVGKTLWAEVENGKLKKPTSPWTIHILEGTSFEASTGKIADYNLRWIVVMPNTTPESLGLPEAKSADKPWLMNPGRPFAHIMIPAVTEQP